MVMIENAKTTVSSLQAVRNVGPPPSTFPSRLFSEPFPSGVLTKPRQLLAP